MEGESTRNRVLVATAVAGAAHLLFDLLTSRSAWTTPPYLLLEHASEGFRDLLLLDRETVLIAVSVISAGVNGAIGGLFGAALAGTRNRIMKLGLALSALWVFSGGLMVLVYLSLPFGLAVTSVVAGVPRAFAVAWLLDRVLPRPESAGEAPSGRG